jgi:hypothetical protein
MGIEHWDFVLANDIPYMEAQVIKYISRWRDKNGMEDLYKAEHFLKKLIEWERNKVRNKRRRKYVKRGTKGVHRIGRPLHKGKGANQEQGPSSTGL